MLTNYGKFIYSLIYCGWDGVGSNSGGFYPDPAANFIKDIYGTSQVGGLGGSDNPISNSEYVGIIFGTNETISADMYTLQNMSDIYPTNTSSIHPVKNGDILTQAFVVSNNSSSDITYTCFGRSTEVSYINNTNYSKRYLTAVYMLDTPVTIPANSSKTIEIKFDLSNL